MVQQVVKGIIGAKGHRLFVSVTVRNATAMIQAGKVDVILLNLNLPNARWEDVVRVIRTQMKPDTPIIVLSGGIVVDTVISFKPLNVSGFVAKTTDFESRLIEEVDKVFGMSGEVSDNLPM